MPGLTLTTDEGEREDPDVPALEAALRRLELEREAYAILAGTDGEYLQATRSDGRLILERQEGSVRFVHRAPEAPRVEALFRQFCAGDPAWKADPGWQRASEEDTAREHRLALLAGLRAQPLKLPVSADGSPWFSTNGEVTALMAFASEEALRETCPDSGLKTLEIIELLEIFLAGPHAQLFLELGGDWVSVDKAEAAALREAAGLGT
ncbi:MAG: hypothetical protein HYZ75_05360 [Elusimicrobia bacterium]|nr:hypothetical protein [Elusimicrobiota bacterium]